MLIKYEKILILIKGAEDESFVKLSNDIELAKITFSKHLTQLVIRD